MYVSNHDVHFKYLTTLCVDYTSIKLGGKKAVGVPGPGGGDSHWTISRVPGGCDAKVERMTPEVRTALALDSGPVGASLLCDLWGVQYPC